MSDLGVDGLSWRKSSRSEEANCVEVAISPADVLVRHSQDHPGKILRFTYSEWHAFLAGVRNNEFDVDMPNAAPEG
jgi:predicted secreted Zn-dependent protease